MCSRRVFNKANEKIKSVARAVTAKFLQGQDHTCTYFSNSLNSKLNRKNQPMSKILLGVFDKQTKSLTLHLSAENGRIFPLQQSIKPHRGAMSEAEHLSLDNLTEAEKYRLLFDTFGSNKKKKELKGRDANKINVDNVVGTDSSMVNAVKRQKLSHSNIEGMKEAAISAKESADKAKVSIYLISRLLLSITLLYCLLMSHLLQ